MKKVFVLAIIVMFGFSNIFAHQPVTKVSTTKAVKVQKQETTADTSAQKKCCAKGEKKCTPAEKKKCEASKKCESKSDKKCCKKVDKTKCPAGEQKKCCKKQGTVEPAEKE